MKFFERYALENNRSVKNDETEVVIYAKVTDWNGLSQASSTEQHVQYEGSFTTGPRARVRVINNEKYIFTLKVKAENAGEVQSNSEDNIEVDKDFTEHFKHAAKKMVKKDRYVFNSENVILTFINGSETTQVQIPNIQYEIDIYERPDGTKSEWCKIDVEIDSILSFLANKYPDIKEFKLILKVSHLPFKPVQPILMSNASPNEKEFVGQLWDNEFNHPVN